MAKNKQVMRVKGGSAVQQDRMVQFTFDGKSYMGCAGDTLASALLANNVHLVGRSLNITARVALWLPGLKKQMRWFRSEQVAGLSLICGQRRSSCMTGW